MFGFLHGPRNNRLYRQIYASCCSSLRDRYGFRALPFVSYEAIFARAIATDLGLLRPPEANAVTCCKTRRRHSALRDGNSKASVVTAEFTSSLAMLLAGVKLDDDVRDSRSISAVLARRILNSKIDQARAFFSRYDPHFSHRLRELLDEHAAMERPGNPVRLDRYTGPTGNAFAMVFRILPIAIASANKDTVNHNDTELFEHCGRFVGQSLIAFDCAVDYASDRKRGHFTPLGGPADVGPAFDFAQRKLIELGWHCNSSSKISPDPEAVGSAILRHRVATISRRKRQVCDSRPTHPRRRRRSETGTIFSTLHPRSGFCDCDCDCGGCDGCGSAAGNVLDCCQTRSCGCDPCSGCCDCCGAAICDSKSSGNEVKEATQLHAAAGKSQRAIAEVVVALSPYGTVRLIEPIDGDAESLATREHPAKSEAGVIEAGEKVVVVRKEAFGLLVRRIAEKAEPGDEPFDGQAGR